MAPAQGKDLAAPKSARNRQHDYDGLEEAFNALLKEEWDIGMRICEIPAHTLKGMMVKLRVSDMLGLESFGDENEAFASIAADIRRLAAAGQRAAV